MCLLALPSLIARIGNFGVFFFCPAGVKHAFVGCELKKKKKKIAGRKQGLNVFFILNLDVKPTHLLA